MVFVSSWNKENVLIKCCLSPSNGPKHQIKPYPTRWHYPLFTYLNQKAFFKELLTIWQIESRINIFCIIMWWRINLNPFKSKIMLCIIVSLMCDLIRLFDGKVNKGLQKWYSILAIGFEKQMYLLLLVKLSYS